MSEIETGKVQVGIWTLMRIARVLNTTAPTLLRSLKWSPRMTNGGDQKSAKTNATQLAQFRFPYVRRGALQ
jgi:hypothetical protein